MSLEKREMKLMLHASKFNGDENARTTAVRLFWADLKALLADIDSNVSKNDEAETKERTVTFYDTATKRLREETNYVFRDRRDMDDDDQKLTLKFRHPERDKVQEHMPDDWPKGAKLEEDVKPRLQVLYSYSENIRNKTDDDEIVDVSKFRVGQIVEIFPSADRFIEAELREETIERVCDYTAEECVVEGDFIQLIERNENSKAETAIILWYDSARVGQEDPDVVEFSFRYPLNGDRDPAWDRPANHVFETIQDKMKEWYDSESKTKTAYVYARCQAG